ncbi:MAG TPA: thioredoxin [Candidatus Wallbacteria bacterium]|nr:thioredoxin [Candidatus Wallbacteria bacterium]
MNTIKENNFDGEVLKSGVPVVVDFFATWCGPCKMIAPLFEELAKEYDGKAKFVKVDIDESPNLASAYKVRGVPTLMVFKGGEIKSTMVGAQPKAKIAEEVNKVL